MTNKWMIVIVLLMVPALGSNLYPYTGNCREFDNSIITRENSGLSERLQNMLVKLRNCNPSQEKAILDSLNQENNESWKYEIIKASH